MVRQSEAEIETVRQERRNIMQNWTSTVINIAKRDGALVSFRTALKNQELNLKGLRAQIDGTKQDISEVMAQKWGWFRSRSAAAFP